MAGRGRRTPPLRAACDRLHASFGPQHWWPGRTRFEIIVGAILTQNTAWSNVEKAIGLLRRDGLLDPKRLHAAPLRRVETRIRPAGYFRVKARRLRSFTGFLVRAFGADLRRMFLVPTDRLRETLLDVHGVGPETADSILLYAGGRPVFVVDAYTRRLLERHGWVKPGASYDEIAALMRDALPRRAAWYNECHALIVALGKEYCRTRPRCSRCPLRRWFPRDRPRPDRRGSRGDP